MGSKKMLRGINTTLVVMLSIVVHSLNTFAAGLSEKVNQERQEQLNKGQGPNDTVDAEGLRSEGENKGEETLVLEEDGEESSNFSGLSSMGKKCRAHWISLKKNGRTIILFGLGITGAGLTIFSVADGITRLNAISKEPNFTQYRNSSPRCAVYDRGYFGRLDPACEAMMDSYASALLEMMLGGTLSALSSFAGFGFGMAECWTR
jgi:hypothetical protein